MRTLLPLLTLLPAIALAEEGAPPSWTGNINGFLGAKYLDQDDWEPVEQQGCIGIVFDTAPRRWPVSLAANLMLSAAHDDDVIDTDGATSELQLGVKKIWDLPGHTRIFLGGGPDIVTASVEVDSGPGDTEKDHDSALGLWLSTGVYWEIGAHFNLGALVTASGAEVTLFDQDVKAGGLFLGLLAGYHW